MKRLIIPFFMISAPAAAMPPGVINPAVTQDNLYQTVCVKGYTKTIRPPLKYTNSVKRRLVYPRTNVRDYELDHIIPLAIGGHPSNQGNLFLQPWKGKCGAHAKDVEEAQWHRDLCAGKVTLEKARSHFSPWVCKE